MFLLFGEMFLQMLLPLFLFVLAAKAGTVSNVVVVMLENQSLNRVYGSMKGIVSPASTSDCNPTPDGGKVCLKFRPPRVQGCDPDHSVQATTFKIYGNTTSPTMEGFAIWESVKQHHNSGSNFCDVLTTYSSDQLPVFTWLAENFVLLDEYHASVPGPTWPNRAYCIAATSAGQTGTGQWNVENGKLFGPARTIFDQMDSANLTWGYYYSTTPWETYMTGIFNNMHRLSHYDEFLARAKAGTLPSYSWINPRSGIDTLKRGSNDFHPDHDAALAEEFLSEIYRAVRNGPKWEETVLIVTFDEHGGFYDPVPPPFKNVPAPDNIVGVDDGFKFDRLGIRVPTLVISAFVEAGIVHGNDTRLTRPTPSSQLDHTSILSSARKWLKVQEGPLTRRDAWATSFENLLSRSTAREVPLETPAPSAPGMSSEDEFNLPINDLQKDLVRMHEMVSGVEWIKRPEIQGHLHGFLQRHHRLALSKRKKLDDQFGLRIFPEHFLGADKFEQGFILDGGVIRTSHLNASGTFYCLTNSNNNVTLSLCSQNARSQNFVFNGENGSIVHVPSNLCTTAVLISGASTTFYGVYELRLEECIFDAMQSFSYYSKEVKGGGADDNSINWGDGAGYLSVVQN